MCAYIESQLNAQQRAASIINWQATPKTLPQKVKAVPATPTIDVLHIEHFAPTPYKDLSQIILNMHLTPEDILYDIGCGDGRVLLTGVTTFSCRGVGVELNPSTLIKAKEEVNLYQLENEVALYQGDALKYTYKDATIVYMYLYPELMEKLIPKLPKNCAIFSYSHKIPQAPDSEQTEYKLPSKASLFHWIKQ
jgi:tRNA A58 N-methylase Trm61